MLGMESHSRDLGMNSHSFLLGFKVRNTLDTSKGLEKVILAYLDKVENSNLPNSWF